MGAGPSYVAGPARKRNAQAWADVSEQSVFQTQYVADKVMEMVQGKDLTPDAIEELNKGEKEEGHVWWLVCSM